LPKVMVSFFLLMVVGLKELCCVVLCENVSWNFCCFPSAFFSYVLCRFVRVKKLARCRESSALFDHHFSRMFSVDWYV
jgi:hypothetical protein